METTMCVKCQRETIRLRTGQCMACAGDEFIRLCTHREAEGACDICAADAETARKAADYDRLAARVTELERERDDERDPESLAGMMRFRGDKAMRVLERDGWRWCDIPACNCGSWHSPTTSPALETIERLTRERDEARALATKLNEKLDETHLHRCRFCEATVTAETSRAQEAEARAEALAAALREVTEIVVDCRRDVALTYSDGIIGDAIARAEAALSAAPPADMAQHPAYRAGVEAGIEKAAKVCDEQQNEPECPERAQYCATAIRALIDTTTPPAAIDRTTAERAAEVCLGRAVRHANAGRPAAEEEARLCADEITRALVGEVRDGR